MKRFGAILIATMLIVSIIGTISASAIEITKNWYLDEHFNNENGKGIRVMTNPYAIRKQADPFQDYMAGSFMIATPAEGGNTRVQLHTSVNRSGEVLNANYSSIWWRGLAANYTNNGFIASSYYFGEPSAYPTGSGILRYGETVDITDSSNTYKYVYQGAKWYEQSFYMTFITYTATEFSPRLTLASDPTTGINPGELHLKLLADGTATVNDQPIDVDVFAATTSENRVWRQLKYIYDFEANKAYMYIDGKLISTYAPESNIYMVKMIDMKIDGRTSWCLDDYVSDPHGGRSLTPFFTDFYINGLKVQSPQDGNAKAVVKLYKDIPAEYTVIGARYDVSGKLVDVKLLNQTDADAVDMSLTVDFGEITETDSLMVTAWDSMQGMGQLTPANALIYEED